MAEIDLEKEIYDDIDVGTEMYYRVPNGEVTIGRVGKDDSEKVKRVKEGWVPLDDYGTFKIQPYHQDHPFEVLFQRGGAKELTLKQIIDQGFNFRPQTAPRCHATIGQPGHFAPKTVMRHTDRCWQGVTPVVFPQLEGQEIPGPFDCLRCTDSETGEPKQFPRLAGLRQHESVVHTEEIGSDRLGQQLIDGFKGGNASSADLDMKGEMLKLQEQIDALTGGNAPVESGFTPAATPYVCGICGDALPTPFKLNSHIAAHKKALVPA